MTETEIKAKALCIGRELSRKAWWTMRAIEADKFCQRKAVSMGVTDAKERQTISVLAMSYVMKGGH